MNKRNFWLPLIVGLIVFYVVYIMFFGGIEPETVATPTTTEAANTEASLPGDYSAAEPNGLNDIDLINLYSGMIVKNNSNGNAYYQRALVYQRINQFNAAIADYIKVISINPDSANAMFNLGLCYEKRLEHDKAIDTFNNALKIKSDDPRIYNARALSYVEKSDFKSAEDDYLKSIALDPKYQQAYFNLGTLYERQKMYNEALTQYDAAIRLGPTLDDPKATPEDKENILEAYYRRGIIYLDLQQLDAATQDVSYVIEHDPKSAKAFRLRAAIYSKSGNAGAAAADEVEAQNLGIENMLNKK